MLGSKPSHSGPGLGQLDIRYVNESDFTAGSVLFSNGTQVTEDNANLFWNDTDNRLGIRTNTPDELLHINGPTGINSRIKLSNTDIGRASSYDLYLGSQSSADYFIGQLRGFWNNSEVAKVVFETGDDTSNKDDGRITFWTSSSGGSPAERFRIDNDGNVGVGQIAPADKFQITDGSGHITFGTLSGANAGLTFQNAAVSAANYSLLGNGLDTFVSRPSGGSIQFREANSTQATLATGGNLGIGTTSPGARLAVLADSEAEAIEIIGRSADNIGQINFRANNGTRLGRIDSRSTFTAFESENELRLSAGGVAGYDVYINSTGSVGIGVASPESTLDVGGSFAVASTTLTAGDTSLDGTYGVVYCDASSGSIVATLPTVASANGRLYYIKKIDSTSNEVKINVTSSGTIDGDTSLIITNQYDSVRVHAPSSGGTEWYVH